MPGAAATSDLPQARHWPALDGLRGVAVLLVIVGHTGLLFPRESATAGAGVAIFFVLSGFLITHVLLREYHGSRDLAGFYLARAVRLLPALTLMVVVCSALWLATGGGPNAVAGHAAPALFYVENFFYGSHQDQIFTHTWSLAVEEQFYLVWPLVLLVLLRFSRERRLQLVVAGIGASILARYAINRVDFAAAYASLPTNAAHLLLGCGLALYGPVALGRRQVARWRAFAVAALLASFVAPTLVSTPWAITYVWSGSAVILVATLLEHRSGLEAKPLRYVGRVSYSWYLWHWPLLWLTGTEWKPLAGGLVCLGAFGIAALSTHLVEEPLRARWRARKHRAARPRPVPEAAPEPAPEPALG